MALTDDNQQDQGGSVSEVANLGEAEEIQPDQSVAGAPENESGETQEGRQGPNARTGEQDRATPEHVE